MKQIFGLIVLMAISTTAFANTKTIECSGPVGGKVARVAGELNLTQTQQGQMVEGKISINGGSDIAVMGGYDKVQGFEYATVAPIKRSKISVISINFNDSEDGSASYVEMSGKMFPLNCGARK